MSQFDYLRSQIEQNIWLGKEILGITNFIRSLIDAPKEFILDLPPIKLLRSLPPLAYLAGVIESSQNLTYVSTSTALIFMETAYGINRAFNSRKYTNLETVANAKLGNLTLSNREVRIYESAIKAHNDTLDATFLARELPNADLSYLTLLDTEPNTILQREENESNVRLTSLYQDLELQLKTAVGKVRKAIQRTLSKLRKIFNLQTQGNKYSVRQLQFMSRQLYLQSNLNYLPKSALVIGTPSIITAINIINNLANFLLSNYLLFPIANFPFQLIGALNNAVTSIVLKFMGGNGAIACKYFSANIMRTFNYLLPSVFRSTGMSAAAWTFLIAYSPYIIIAAILIITAMQSDQKLGEFLYVFGFNNPDDTPDSAIRVLSDSDDTIISNAIVFNNLLELGKKIQSESGRKYQGLYGFSVDDKGIPQFGLDLKNNAVIKGNEVQNAFSQILQLFPESEVH
jgi:hypothetical protein